MLASPESALAPGHRLPMKGSIMNLFLLPLPGPPARRGCGPPRARPLPGRGEAALRKPRRRRRRRERRAVTGERPRGAPAEQEEAPPPAALALPAVRAGPGAGGAPRSPASARELGPAAPPPPPPAPQIPPFLDSEARACY